MVTLKDCRRPFRNTSTTAPAPGLASATTVGGFGFAGRKAAA